MTRAQRVMLGWAIGLAVVLRWPVGDAVVARQIAAKNVARATASAPDDRHAYAAEAMLLFPDSVDFAAMARNLGERGELVDQANRRAWRTPLYAFLLAGWGWVGGGTLDIAWLRHVNRILDMVNLVWVVLIARRLANALWRSARTREAAAVALRWRAWAPVWAAWGYAVEPWSVYFCQLILSDTVGHTAVLASLWTGMRWLGIGDDPLRGRSPRAAAGYAIATGVAAAAAVWAKAAFSLWGFFIVGMAAWRMVGRRRDTVISEGGHPSGAAASIDAGEGGGLRRRFLRTAPWVLAGWMVAMAPWWIRNAVVFGAFVPFSTMGGFTLYESVHPKADGGANLGSVSFPEGWRARQRVLTESMEVYAWVQPCGLQAERHLFFPRPVDGSKAARWTGTPLTGGEVAVSSSPCLVGADVVSDGLRSNQYTGAWDVTGLTAEGLDALFDRNATNTPRDEHAPYASIQQSCGFSRQPLTEAACPCVRHRGQFRGLLVAATDSAHRSWMAFHHSCGGYSPWGDEGGMDRTGRWVEWLTPSDASMTGESRLKHYDSGVTMPAVWSVPDWVSAPGNLRTDFRPGYAWMERDADRYLRRIIEVNTQDLRATVWRMIRQAPAKIGRLWRPTPHFVDARQPLYQFVSAGHGVPVMVGVFLFMMMFRRAWRAWGLLLLPALYLTVLHSVFMGSIRYRLPATGGLVVLAAFGWLALGAVVGERLRRSRRRPPSASPRDAA